MGLSLDPLLLYWLEGFWRGNSSLLNNSEGPFDGECGMRVILSPPFCFSLGFKLMLWLMGVLPSEQFVGCVPVAGLF